MKTTLTHKRTAVNRALILSCCLTLIALTTGRALAQDTGSVSFLCPTANQKISIRPMLEITDNFSVSPAGGSILVRSPTGVFATLHGSGFTPGDAVSVWFIFFNHSEYCAGTICTPDDAGTAATQASVLNAGGAIVGLDGNVSFGKFRAFGDTARALIPGAGLQEPFAAQIQLVFRSHGKASTDSATLKSQLSEFFGGCPGGNGCTDTLISVHQPEP